MPAREPRQTRPSPHVTLYREGRWIRVARRVADIAKQGGWSETPPPAETVAATHPVHVGGGVYELSDGTRIRGKDQAAAAEQQLDQGDD